MSAEMLEAAVQLAACGFDVLPIKSGSKAPACEHGVKDATKDAAQLERWFLSTSNTTGVSGEGFVIFDFDCHGAADGRDALRDWEAEHGELPETLAQTTPSGGYHLVYRCAEEVRPSVNAELAVDVRAWGSYVVCDPTPGYCWETDPLAENIADADERVMAFLDFVRPEKPEGKRGAGIPEGKLKEGEGRNEFLFRQGRSARAKGADDDTVAAFLTALNQSKCSPPVGDDELWKTIGSVCSVAPGYSDEVKEQAKRGRPRKFEHNVVGRRLIEERGACLVDGETPAIRAERGNYVLGWDAFDAVLVDMYDDCTEANRREVKAWVKAKAESRRQSPATLIAFLNGVLDVETMELRDFAPSDLIPNVVPHEWNPDARSQLLDRTLWKMADGDDATFLNLTEFMGMCMMRSVKHLPFFPVLIGEGANGKSTYIGLLKDMVGMANISGLQPKDIASKFLGAHIVGKTANLGDDIASGYLDDKDCSVIKSVATGDLMFTDVKGTKGFHFEPYCTMVFSCNAFPRLADTTPGFMRRLFPVEFNAVFSKEDPDYDPTIGEKLREEETLQYACVVAVEGLRRALYQNSPTPNAMSEAMKSEIAREANTCLQWIGDANVTAEQLVGMTKEEVYSDYREWCDRNGYSKTAMGSGTVAAQIGTYFRLRCDKFDHRDLGGVRKTVRVFEKR